MNLGIGVMLGHMSSNAETVLTLQKAIGKNITAVELNSEDELVIEVESNYKFKLFDDGQSCCESRYMRTDDDLQSFIGDIITGFELKEAPSIEADYDVHEVQFLQVNTNKGCFTMSSHNEHNGYYGGFYIVAKEI